MRFPAVPPDHWPIISEPSALLRIAPHVAATLPDGRYLHWDDLRNRPPPPGLSREESWAAQKLARQGARVVIPRFSDAAARPFWFCRLARIDQVTHELDRRDAAREMLTAIGDEPLRRQYRVDQLIEEAINSSLVEGARLTTRAQAKALIRDGGTPRSPGERMVLNNYNAMERLLGLVSRKLTVDDMLEIHAILAAGALEVPDGAGRLRTVAENVRVEDVRTGETWFTPPPASELGQRLTHLLAFANEEAGGPFLHPLLRAITLHFWLAYLHPFVDGNGRMARALFYWQMLRSGYDFAQYLSISGPIDRSPRSYYRAFVHTETDDGDLTYFFLHQLAVLDRASRDLLAHLRERSQSLADLSRSLVEAETLNGRQQALLSHLVRNAHVGVTVRGHGRSHGVSYLTARKDLQDLESRALLRRVRVGREDRYFATDGVMTRLSRRA